MSVKLGIVTRLIKEYGAHLQSSTETYNIWKIGYKTYKVPKKGEVDANLLRSIRSAHAILRSHPELADSASLESPVEAPAGPQRHDRPDIRISASLRLEAALEVLRTRPDYSWTPKEITEKLPETLMKNLKHRSRNAERMLRKYFPHLDEVECGYAGSRLKWIRLKHIEIDAGVMETEDMSVLNTDGLITRAGSTPVSGTKLPVDIAHDLDLFFMDDIKYAYQLLKRIHEWHHEKPAESSASISQESSSLDTSTGTNTNPTQSAEDQSSAIQRDRRLKIIKHSPHFSRSGTQTS